MIQCCNFLRFSRMSELATGCGSRILPRMYNGNEPESDATNQCPIQPRPPKGAWTIWNKYLGFMVTPQTTLALQQPLGEWKEAPPRTPWKYHEPSDPLYFQHSQGTTEYHRIRGSSRRSINRGFIPAREIYEAPSGTVDIMKWKKQIPPICQDTESVNSHQHQFSMVLLISILRVDNSMHGYFNIPSALSSFKIQSRKGGLLQSVMDPTKTSAEQRHGE
jgi:hypothetical protein